MYKFLKHGYGYLILSIFIDLLWSVVMVGLILMAKGKIDIILILILMFLIVIWVIMIVATLGLFSMRIIIEEYTISEVSIFGKVRNKCYINDIQKVRFVLYHPIEGVYIELCDCRNSDFEESERRKYVRFKNTKKSLAIIQKIWNKEIITIVPSK